MRSEKEGLENLAEKFRVNPKTIEAIKKRGGAAKLTPAALRGGSVLIPHLNNGEFTRTGEIIPAEKLEEITRMLKEQS